MSLKILINGGGIAGPALSIFLLKSSSPSNTYNITIIERTPNLRTAGQQIDLRAQGIPIVRKLGLLETIKSKTVQESGIAFVDTHGVQKALLGRNDSGKGAQSFTSEYEIMRGDLVEVLYQASLSESKKAQDRAGAGSGSTVEYRFGCYTTEIEQLGDGVHVTFSDGKTERFDLFVGADGQGSRTRRMVFGQEVSDRAFKFLKMYLAYFSIPTQPDDVALCKAYLVPGRRLVFLRRGNRSVAQGYLGIFADSPELSASVSQSVAEQKELWARLFKGAGWQTERILEGMMESDDFYAQSIGQVKMDRYSKGRVVLLGDAGYCPAPVTGMGTSCALVGSYVLAGEIARHGADMGKALEAYETVMRPFVAEAQKLPPGVPGILYKETKWGIWLLHTLLSIVVTLRIDKLISRLMPEGKGGWKVPEYPELNLDG